MRAAADKHHAQALQALLGDLQPRPQRRQLIISSAPRLCLLPQRRRLLLVRRRELLELLSHRMLPCRGLLLQCLQAGSLRRGSRRPARCISCRLRLPLERRVQLLRLLRAAGLQAVVLRLQRRQRRLRLVQLCAGRRRLGLQRGVAAGQVGQLGLPRRQLLAQAEGQHLTRLVAALRALALHLWSEREGSM